MTRANISVMLFVKVCYGLFTTYIELKNIFFLGLYPAVVKLLMGGVVNDLW